MAQYSNLKAYIEEKIYENGTQAITGDILQDVLKVMTDELGEFYQMGGVASPSTDPGTPDAKVIYFATEAGTYTNFGGITLAAGEVALLIFETRWTKVELNVLSSANGGVKTANLADGAVTTEKIAGGAVETAKIANSAVTSGKVADGAIGTAKIADGAIDADKIAANAVESAKIKNGAVTEGKINDGAVTAGKVAANAVTTAKIADDAVTTAKLNDGAVTEDKIATDAVTSDKVKDGAIGTAKIAAGAVTHAKIGAGAVEESNIKDGAVTSDKIANGAVGSDQLAEGAFSAENLADGSVTTDKLADEAVTAEKIADGAVTAGKFANGSVTTIKLGSGAVTTEKIGDGMVTRQKLADSSVSTSKIIDGAVTTDKVADGAITDAKLENPVSVSQNTNTKGQQLYISDTKIGNINDFFNVNSYNNKGNAYSDANAARNAVPTNIKSLGITIGYLLTDGWHIEQFVGDNLDNWLGEFSWFEILYTQKLFGITKDDADLLIGDEQGNVLLEMSKGELKTKNFDSAFAPQPAMSNTADDFLIGDEQGNVILQVKKGKINVNGFAERPASGIENFKVSVNYKNTFNEIGEDVNEVEDNTNYIYDDDCVIGLPSNYSPTGKPIRLIIHCGGTGERITDTTNPITANYHGWNYFLHKGFAVLDCNGIADDYITNIRGGGSRNHFGCKYLLQSYKKAYDYVINKYNIAKDGCFVTGISMGGLASFMIVQSGMLPVLAQGGFCPCIDIFKQSFLNPWSDQATKTPIDYGFDTKQESETNAEWFVRNISKVIGWNSLEKNTIGDKTNLWNYFSGVDEENVYNGLSKVYPCPLKIWHCKNDTTVVYRYSEYCVKMIRNAGGTAELHSFTTGGHAGGWSYSTINDNGFTTSINFYEAILFFNRFINN